ncbi:MULTISPECIES: UxaA family hydrolase [unclassified Pseudomonas]|uniref:UxaA family hydrolase n=1 Tax=unclassified Pseudomonas TaxID=196821 RepID=UPI000C876630|nr:MULTISPECIES: altronate dehydratase family protein [unclassified Pseudomonas]PMU11444.1 galactonate dehydratase [Pseudomonas sp. FW305-20]PMU18490.1 galactonate dehydratase [Pseudomonas sp. FW305-122]PMU40254.1 galactonate dehydratase [Pseudomonas sp. FW305-47B]PMX59818.1 galactonate dehydratase [Pseudomonas sp. FW305-33]PMX68388.1 galactonate dehydratase [Pseudomonas sp. FW305-60]
MQLIARTRTSDAAVIRLNPLDNVLIARQALPEGLSLEAEAITVRQLIPSGHKVATQRVEQGQPLRRYGQIIGFASQLIEAGDHVHVHNVEMGEFARDYAFGVDAHATPSTEAVFQGIVRADGRVATRNYVGILTSVNCSATVARAVADYFRRDIHPEALAAFPNIDGVVALTHGAGCAVDPNGEALGLLRRTLGGYAVHPNFAAVLIIGLGCETNQIESLLETQGLKASDQLRAFTIQGAGGTSKTIASGIEQVKALLSTANQVQREPVSARHLIVGLQCGGSDGYSGITANPALGNAIDRLVAAGGTAILSETPEIYGAEHLLTRRAVSREVGEKLIARIHWWEDYCQRMNAELNNNPSAGNKAGGLTTILEKSLGAVAKAGSSNLVDVYLYAEAVRAKGLVFMDTPGYDPVSATGQVAGGANLIAFTTGRGSAYGCAPTPSIKLATNNRVFEHQEEDMDVNCGGIADGSTSIEECGAYIFEQMLRIASGERSKSEQHGYGQNEFVPWQIGAVT